METVGVNDRERVAVATDRIWAILPNGVTELNLQAQGGQRAACEFARIWVPLLVLMNQS